MPKITKELEFPYKVENILSDYGLADLGHIDSKIHKLFQTFSWLTKAIRQGDRKRVRIAKHVMHQQIGHLLDLTAPLSEEQVERRMIDTVCAFIVATERIKLIEPDTIMAPPKAAIEYCRIKGVDLNLQFSDYRNAKSGGETIPKLLSSHDDNQMKSAALDRTERTLSEDSVARSNWKTVQAARKRAANAKHEAAKKARALVNATQIIDL